MTDMSNTGYFVLVYVGYEGIEHILWVSDSAEEVRRRYLHTKSRIEEHLQRAEEESDDCLSWFFDNCVGVWTYLRNPDQLCVQSYSLEDGDYDCVCPKVLAEEERAERTWFY